MNTRVLTARLCLILLGFFWMNGNFAQTFPGSTLGGSENDAGVSLCRMPDGGFAIAGLTRSEGAGSTDLYVVRLNRYGCRLWSRTFGIDVQEQAFWVEASADGGLFVTGYSYVHPLGRGRQDFFLLRLDAAGSLIWQKCYGSNLLDVGLCGKPVPGGYAALGISREGDTRGNFYFARLDPEGNRLWYKLYDHPWVEYGHEFLRLDDGDYMLFGTESGFLFPSELDHAKPHADLMLIRTDSLGNERWRRFYGGKRHDFGKAIRPTGDGGYYLFGSTQNHGAGSFDMYLLRVDANGDTLWSRSYGGPDWDYGNSLDIDAEGNLYMLGTSSSLGGTDSPDIYLVKAAPDGDPLWSITLGGDSSDHGSFVRCLEEGGCAITGYSSSMGSGGKDIYFSVISSDGEVVPYIDESGSTMSSIIFPNPVTDVSYIKMPGPLHCPAAEWRVFDGQGRLIATRIFEAGSTPSIQRTDFPAGAYVYELVRQGQMVLKGKFLVY